MTAVTGSRSAGIAGTVPSGETRTGYKLAGDEILELGGCHPGIHAGRVR